METLIYCLDILKIKEDSEFYRKALELKESVNEGNEWISAMKIIANAYSSVTSYTFSQSQLSDFLTLSARAIEGKKMSNVILKMYRDIMGNYDSLKLNYPRVIVDVISILNKGVDTKGTKVNPINIEKYYQSKMQQGMMTEEEGEEKTAPSTAAAAAAIHKEKILLSKKDLVESLSQNFHSWHDDLGNPRIFVTYGIVICPNLIFYDINIDIVECDLLEIVILYGDLYFILDKPLFVRWEVKVRYSTMVVRNPNSR